MRIPQLILALAGTLLCTGCSDLISLHAFVTDKEAALDPRLVGVWAGEDDLYIVRQDGNGYTISHADKSASTVYKLKARMLKVGEARILDLTRIWMEGATLRMAFLDSKWLREQASAHLAVEGSGDRQLITSPGEEVKRFLITYGADDRAFEKPNVLTRQ